LRRPGFRPAGEQGRPERINIPSKVGQVAAVRVLARERHAADAHRVEGGRHGVPVLRPERRRLPNRRHARFPAPQRRAARETLVAWLLHRPVRSSSVGFRGPTGSVLETRRPSSPKAIPETRKT
jgi:hypothetical protein